MKKLRTENHLTQTDLAKKLFISQKTVSAYESGKRQPSIEQLPKIAEILHCSIEDLVLALIATKQTYTSKLNKRSKLGG